MDKDLVIEKIFDAPVEKVWDAWTNPETLKKWWGPKDFTAPDVNVDFQVGGKYLLSMAGEVPGIGPVKAWSTGVYKEIIPMKKIVVTDSFSDENGNIVPATSVGLSEGWPMEIDITMLFEAQGDKTKFTLRYPALKSISEQDASNMDIGWNQSLDKLAKALA